MVRPSPPWCVERPVRRLVLFIPLVVLTAAPLRGRRQEAPPDLTAYRTELAFSARAGSWWWTSNSGQATTADEPEAFGLRMWIDPGGISASGCLWSIRDGEADAVVWIFHQGWDGAEGRPFYYQSHTSGQGTGMGHLTSREGDSTEMVQDFWWGGGVHQRTKHRIRRVDEDTYVGASQSWTDGDWRPGRTYTWERRGAEEPLPCGPRT